MKFDDICSMCGRPYGGHQEIVGMGRVCPMAVVTFRAKQQTAEAERAAIVAWLRRHESKLWPEFYEMAARKIERGEHLAAGPE
jgi:hypothetical protein